MPPWSRNGVEVRGHADAVTNPEPRIRIYPERSVGWGLDDPSRRNARNTPKGARAWYYNAGCRHR